MNMLVNDSCRTKTTFKGKIVFLFYDSLSPFHVNRVSRISCPVSGVELCYRGYQDTIQLKPAVTNIPMTPKTTMQTATNPIGTAWPFTNIQASSLSSSTPDQAAYRIPRYFFFSSMVSVRFFLLSWDNYCRGWLEKSANGSLRTTSGVIL